LDTLAVLAYGAEQAPPLTGIGIGTWTHPQDGESITLMHLQRHQMTGSGL